METPNVAVQVFLSLVKWFLVILVIVNLIWAGIFISYVRQSFSAGTHSIEMNQDGTDNNQSITNG